MAKSMKAMKTMKAMKVVKMMGKGMVAVKASPGKGNSAGIVVKVAGKGPGQTPKGIVVKDAGKGEKQVVAGKLTEANVRQHQGA